MRLNHERVREEQAGHIRYLRPAYQVPDKPQAVLALPPGRWRHCNHQWHQPASVAHRVGPADAGPARRAVASGPAAEQRAGRGRLSAREAREVELLATLAALSLVRQTAEGAYVSSGYSYTSSN